nr:MAG TPA_asm: hypothetical protein [Caudoviricetes sp.]
MKNKIAWLCIIISLFAIGCGDASGITKEQYESVVAERDEYKSNLEGMLEPENDSESISQVDNTVDGNEPEYLSQLEVKEYSYINSIGDALYFLIIKNNSNDTLKISSNSTVYNEEGTMIGATQGSVDAVEAGFEVCLTNYFSDVEGAKDFKYSLDVEKEDYYKPVLSNLDVEYQNTDKKVIVTCSNTGPEAVRFVEATALFFKDGELVGSDSTYFTDDNSELKPGANLIKELSCYESFDDVKVYFTGRK